MMHNTAIPRLRCITLPPDRTHQLELVRPENWVQGEHYARKGFSHHTVDFFHDSYYESD